jgi:Zincin-like metallopeptidase
MDDDLPPDPFPGDPFADNEAKAKRASNSGGPEGLGDLGALFGQGGLGSLGGLGGLSGMAGLGGLGGLAGLGGFAGAQGTPGLQWDSARQAAIWTAAGGSVEPNLDPLERIGYSDLLTKVRREVIATLGLPEGAVPATINAQTRAGFAAEFLAELRSLLDAIVAGIATPASANAGTAGDSDTSDDDGPQELAAIGQLFAMLGPVMNSPQLGTMVGTMATGALGTADLVGTPAGQLMVIPANVNAFAAEWSIDPVVARSHVVIVEAVTAGVMQVSHVQDRIAELVQRYAAATRPNPQALRDSIGGMLGGLSGSSGSSDADEPSANSPFGNLGGLLSGFGLGGLGGAAGAGGGGGNADDATKAMRSLSGDRGLIGVSETLEQAAIRSQIRTLLVPLAGVIEYGVAVIGARMLGDNRQVMEAWRRRRNAPADAIRSLANLLGVQLTKADLEASGSFVGGVLQRVGSDGLAALWESATNLPTAAEVEAPGLWLARIGLTD